MDRLESRASTNTQQLHPITRNKLSVGFHIPQHTQTRYFFLFYFFLFLLLLAVGGKHMWRADLSVGSTRRLYRPLCQWGYVSRREAVTPSDHAKCVQCMHTLTASPVISPTYACMYVCISSGGGGGGGDSVAQRYIFAIYLHEGATRSYTIRCNFPSSLHRRPAPGRAPAGGPPGRGPYHVELAGARCIR